MVPETRDTRQLLLTAARDEFAEHGIAGARVDRIAKAAGVNKERIYGHFGNKEQLFDIVLEEAMDEIAEAIPLRRDDQLRDYVGAKFDFHREHPQLLRLLMWESLQRRETPRPPSAHRLEMYSDKVDAMQQHLGTDDRDAAAFAVFAAIGIGTAPLILHELLPMILGHTPDPADLRRRVVDFADGALERPGAE